MLRRYHAGEGLMYTSQTQVCPRCSYDANLATVTHCIICGYPLKPTHVLPEEPTTQRISKFPLRWLGVILLFGGLLGGGGYLLWKNLFILPTPTNQLVRSPAIQLHPSFRDVQNIPRGLFNYGGAVTFAAMNSTINEAINRTHPEFRLRYTEPLNMGPGSSAGIAMLLDGQLSFAQSARPLEDAEYSKAKDRNLTLEQVPIAIDGIVFYVHPNVPISGLSIDQLQAIYLGKIRNWQQLGGPNLAIVPYSLDPKLVSMINFLLGSQQGWELGNNVKIVRDITTAIRQVAATPGGIGYSSASLVKGQRTVRLLGLSKTNARQYTPPFLGVDQVNIAAFQNGTYPLTRRLFVIIRRDGTPDEWAGITYANLLLSKEGQQMIEKSGFVPLHR
jgi:phosphate transport system substrate-binding protein